LSKTAHVAMSEDPETASKEGLSVSVSLDLLSHEKPNQGLSGGQPDDVGSAVVGLRHGWSLSGPRTRSLGPTKPPLGVA
jgi:hypothetical protein